MALNKKKKIIITAVCLVLIISSILLSVFLINEKAKVDELNKFVSAFTVGVGTYELKGYEINFKDFRKFTRDDFNIELEEGLFYTNGKLYGSVKDLDKEKLCLVKYKKHIIYKITVKIAQIDGVVYTKEDFLSIENQKTKNFIMARDIDLKNVTKGLSGFQGYFFGNNFKFNNLNLSSVKSLFGETKNACIEGVNVENVIGKTTENYVGVLSGKGYSTEFINCSVSGKIDVEVVNTAYIGGLVGYNEEVFRRSNDEITDSFLSCKSNLEMNIVSNDGDLYVGGIVGYYKNGLVLACTNDGNITINAKNNTSIRVGGITGGINKFYYPYDTKVSVLDTSRKLKNNGNINLTAENSTNEIFVGGIMGELVNQNLYDTENFGEIICQTENSKIVGGGILGFAKVTSLKMSLKMNKQNGNISSAGSGQAIWGGVVGIIVNVALNDNVSKIPNSSIVNAIIGLEIGKDESI